MGGERAEELAIPFDDDGDELGDVDVGLGAEGVKGGAEGVTHAESADEDGGRGREVGASEIREGSGGALVVAGHEVIAVSDDEELVAPAAEDQDLAIRGVSVTEFFPGQHDREDLIRLAGDGVV